MKGSSYLFAGGLLLGAVALGWRFVDTGPAQVVAEDLTIAPVGSQPPAREPSAVEMRQLLLTPQVQAQQRRLAFHQDYRAFFSSAPSLTREQRAAKAQALQVEIEDYERRNELAMSEALLLQLALIQVTHSDEQAQKARAEALVARYQARSAARAAQAKPDARFQRYKADEQRIVEEVLALERIPDGLSRDQYLRQRLQHARESAYR
ncbi:hypothetical protein HP532_09385 [Pseudomonas sp. CrR25]|nr:hypothetical protein [Pseudomonas sp. CrR25]